MQNKRWKINLNNEPHFQRVEDISDGPVLVEKLVDSAFKHPSSLGIVCVGYASKFIGTEFENFFLLVDGELDVELVLWNFWYNLARGVSKGAPLRAMKHNHNSHGGDFPGDVLAIVHDLLEKNVNKSNSHKNIQL